MCGICGIVSFDRSVDADLVADMVTSLEHRGPDDSAVVVDHGAVLGHSRLALIDVAGGAQPLGSADGTLWVTFNGEVFNYVELREELRSLGHHFTTVSDTEVVVHAYEQWGASCVERFNGQWALAVWDRRRRRLVLARDRMGVRPLYYRVLGRELAFASEVKTLFTDRSVTRELDPAGLKQVWTYWSCVAPSTVFTDIRQLAPGHVATFDDTGLRVDPYWSQDFPERGREASQDLEENAAALREAVTRATRLRFERSDFPVGAYLSGGLDSAVTAATIRHATSADLTTFSVRFTDDEFDEGPYQRLMVERLGTTHHTVDVSHRDIAEVFPEVVRQAESPLLRSAPAPLFLLSRLVRENGYKVVVTGEGADEVLGGYDIYREARVRQFWARDPGSTMRDGAVGLLYPWLARNPGKAPAFARSFFGAGADPTDRAMSHHPRWSSTSALTAMLSPALQSSMAATAVADPAERMPAAAEDWDPLSRAQWLEIATLLPGYILASQGDRMLMANSVEGRFPFLDREVVELASQLPARHKLFGLEEKFVLKRAFADLVPPEILARPKQPYRAPDAPSFFADGVPDWVAEVTSPRALAAAGVFDPRQVAGLVEKARRRSRSFGNTDNMRMVSVLSTQLLHEQLVVGSGLDRPGRLAPRRVVDIRDTEEDA
ncbi:asparagine synthase (glutamine-hydrolyzing) [Nocardioides glacieisoli]|uniref:asparagine synthase (glutamine-hydrolyzing) n=1 Tax=Nocardioides glacieisoli TaxID=1168730 RepID=A0A4Q2RSE5_9ACTN|nr:asparagine synthase (glutamine-hydrolyzing) [Nocardioides glacieisoli]RYB90715.1 asparagine synthase (glutamine-hydrolyzing) [Nocardioides glacieisoli]